MLLLLFVAATVIFIAALLVMTSSKNLSQRFFDWKNDAVVSYHAVVSNAEDILFSFSDRISLFEQPFKVAVLTGGNRGIGIHVLEKLLICKMTVVLGVRDPASAQKAIESTIDDSVTKGKVIYEKCDTGDIESVRGFAKKVQDQFPSIHLLVNNAGILFAPYQKTKAGFESQMAVNYLGHFLLSHLLLPQLIAGSKNNENVNSRIVNVSSCANQAGQIDYDDFNNEKYYHDGLAYANSKLAQIMFTNHLNRLCQEKKLNVQVHAAHPGIVDTDIYHNSVWGSLGFVRKLLFKTSERGARAIIYAAISPDLEDKGGSFISNCRVSGANAVANNDAECKKFFEFTCNILRIEEFGRGE